MKQLRAALPLGLAFLLSACGGTTTPPTPAPQPGVQNLTVSGAVTGATTTLITPTDTNGSPIGQARAVDAASNFTVTLNPPAFSEPFNPAAECRGGQATTNTLELSTFTARIADAFFKPSGGTATSMRLISRPGSGTLRLVRHQYVSESVTAQGQVQCAEGFNPLASYQLTLARGWNRVLSELTFSGNDIMAITYNSIPLDEVPAGFAWVAE